eukprot:13566684-Ditylum_brightwellii.AAC.1
MPLEERFNIQRVKSSGQMYDSSRFDKKIVNELRVFLGYPEFRPPQGDVCVAAMAKQSDVVYLAPTGHGKSLCFIIPAAAQGGITFIIEPLKEIIVDQVKKLKSAGK